MPHNVNTEPTPKSHPGFMDFLVAGGPQLIPAGGTLLDYFKSFPTVYMREKAAFDWEPKDSKIPEHAGIATAMWVGGHALITDILLSGSAEVATALPYIRALVCGLAYSTWKDPKNHTSKFYEWPVKLYDNDPTELSGIRSLLAFMVGFLGAKNNVGGGPWMTGATIGLATSSAMIFNPFLFHPHPDKYDLTEYTKIVIPFTMLMGLLSKLLGSRMSPTAFAMVMGLINATLEKSRLQTLVFKNLAGYDYPPHVPPPITPPPHNGRMMTPLVSYTAY